MHVDVKNAMKKQSSLVKSDETRTYWAVLPELGCIRFPSLVAFKTGTPVVVERKKRISGKIPSEPWEHHELQLAIYMLSLEWIGLKTEFGVLEYVKPETGEIGASKFVLNEELRRRTLDAVETVKGLITDLKTFVMATELCNPIFVKICIHGTNRGLKPNELPRLRVPNKPGL